MHSAHTLVKVILHIPGGCRGSPGAGPRCRRERPGPRVGAAATAQRLPGSRMLYLLYLLSGGIYGGVLPAPGPQVSKTAGDPRCWGAGDGGEAGHCSCPAEWNRGAWHGMGAGREGRPGQGGVLTTLCSVQEVSLLTSPSFCPFPGLPHHSTPSGMSAAAPQKKKWLQGVPAATPAPGLTPAPPPWSNKGHDLGKTQSPSIPFLECSLSTPRPVTTHPHLPTQVLSWGFRSGTSV